MTKHTIDFDQLPLGFIFDPRVRPWKAEAQHARGWTDVFNTTMFPSLNWRIVEEDDRNSRALEFFWKRDASLVCGERDWTDYSVEAEIRQMHAHGMPWFDDEYVIVSRTGLILRQQDVRRFYILCLEGRKRVVLYHRNDEKWTVLAERALDVDSKRYYRLRASCEGRRIRCELDGAPLFDVEHDGYATGLVGLRTNCLSRYRAISVVHEDAAAQKVAIGRTREQREIDELRERNPKAVLAKTIKLPVEMTSLIWPGKLKSPDKSDLVVIPRELPNHLIFRRILGVNQSGETLWEVVAKDSSRWGAKLHAFGGTTVTDVNGDGLDEVVTAFDGMVKVLRGTDGKTLVEAPLPTCGIYDHDFSSPYSGGAGAPMRYVSIFPVQWKPKPAAKGYVLIEEYPSEGGNCIVALDDKLQQIWRRYLLPINYGHTIDVWDVDGDGRDEVIAGYTVVNADGEVVWRMQGYEQIDDQTGARHPDCMSVGDLSGTGNLQIVYAGGGEGVFFVDGKTGEVTRRHRPGHIQWVWAAKMREDVAGLQLVTNTLHGNPGIIGVYDASGNLLHRWQADNENSFTPPVNWSGSGEHLIPLTCNYENFGLWDARGRKVVDRWITEDELAQTHGGPILRLNYRPHDLLGTGRDQILLLMFGEVRVYAQDQPFTGKYPYRTRRRSDVWPMVSYPV